MYRLILPFSIISYSLHRLFFTQQIDQHNKWLLFKKNTTFWWQTSDIANILFYSLAVAATAMTAVTIAYDHLNPPFYKNKMQPTKFTRYRLF